jgi:hypothetical protein
VWLKPEDAKSKRLPKGYYLEVVSEMGSRDALPQKRERRSLYSSVSPPPEVIVFPLVCNTSSSKQAGRRTKVTKAENLKCLSTVGLSF